MAGEPKPPLLAVVLTGSPSNLQQSQQIHNQQSTLTLTTDTENLTSPPTSPLTSPPNNQHRRNKGNKRKSNNNNNNNNNNRWLLKKIQNLTEVFNPIPFVPKLLDLHKHEDVLKRLGLYKFSKLNLDKNIRTDLLVELIVSYNPKKKCSYVSGKRIRVNRADLARALELPVMKQEKVDLEMDEAVFSDEEIGFIEDFVFNWVLLHEESWVMPVELENWTRCVRDGLPEKLDAASLVWYKVEKELSQGVRLGDCYYASHLQRLIRVQHGEVFTDGEGNVKEKEKEEEVEETVSVVQEVDVELSLGVDVEKVVCRDVREDDETMVDAEECKEEVENDLGGRILKRCQSCDLETKVEKVVDEHDGKEEHEEKEEKVSIVQEDDVELTLEADFEKVVHRDVREDDEMMVDAEECKEAVEVEVEKMEEQMNQKNDLGQHILQRGQSSDLEAKVEIVVDEHEHEHEEKEEQEETVSIVQEDSVELTLGADVRKIVYQDVREDGETMVNAEEWKEEVDVEKMEEQEKWKIDLDEQILQRCEISDLNSYEETEVEEVVDEQIEQVEEMEEQVNWKNGFGERVLLHCQSSDVNNYEEIKAVEVVDEQTKQVDEIEERVYCKNVLGEHILQHCDSSGLNNYEGSKVEEVVDEQIELVDDEDDDDKEEEECGDDDGERFVGGFDMEANDDIMDRDGLNDHIRYTSHGVSPIDLFGSRDDSIMSHGGPSFFGNAGKRVIQPEEDMHRLDGSSKRFKTNEMWEHKHNDFDSCMVQMQQWVEKARMIQESNEASYVTSKYHQDATINQLQERNQIMENIIKSKDEQLAQKHAEVFRLERELYLMGDLVVGYRKALNDTRVKFAEYRKRIALQEEPLYKDAGPGGLVLSTRELERQRLKQEEYKMKIQTCLKSFEEECVNQLKILDERVLKMAEKLVFFGIEVKRLEEIAARCKETQKPRDELELSPEPEEKQKSYEEVLDNEASMESVHPKVDESKEREGGEEH